MRAIRMVGYGLALALIGVAKVAAYCFALVASLGMVVFAGCAAFDVIGLALHPTARLATAAGMMAIYAVACLLAATTALYIPGRLGDKLTIRREQAALERIGRLRLDRDASFNGVAGA